MNIYYVLGILFLVLVFSFFIAKMRMLWIFSTAVVVIFFLRTGVFIVNEGSQVVITQFGKIIGEPYTQAGVYFKIPFMWKANYLDKRIYSERESQVSIPTKDGYFITLDTIFVWKINDAAEFLSSMDNVEAAKIFLRNIVSGSVRETISEHNLLETVRSKNVNYDTTDSSSNIFGNENRKLSGMDDKITTGRSNLSGVMTKQADQYSLRFGIKVMNILIRDVKYEPSVERIIYSRMVSEKLRDAARLRSTGRSEALRIRGEMNKKYQSIIAPAMQQALLIRGKAEANVTRIQAEAYGQDSDFYKFWRVLRVYKASLPKMSQGLILSTDSSFLQWLGNQNDKSNLVPPMRLNANAAIKGANKP